MPNSCSTELGAGACAAQAVVHHGGAGTFAASAAAGAPQLAVPVEFDQHFWGQRAAALGVGPPPLPVERVSAATAAAALRDLLLGAAGGGSGSGGSAGGDAEGEADRRSGGYRTAAQRLQRQLAAEPRGAGAAIVVAAVRQLTQGRPPRAG